MGQFIFTQCLIANTVTETLLIIGIVADLLTSFLWEIVIFVFVSSFMTTLKNS